MTTTQHTTEEAGILERIDKLVVAVRAMDLESVMSMYAPDIVSFDIEPRCSTWGQRQRERIGHACLRRTSAHLVTRFGTSQSSSATASHSGTA